MKTNPGWWVLIGVAAIGCGSAHPAIDAAAGGTDAGSQVVAPDAGFDASLDGGCATLIAYYADCDGDHVPLMTASHASGCFSPATPPVECPTGHWTTTAPEVSVDCNDGDASLTDLSAFFADCDGDGFAVAGAVPRMSCGRPDERPACGLGEVAAWSSRAPVGDSNK